MKKLTLLSLLSFFSFASSAEYSVGQVWAYKTREGENQSTVLINKIENFKKSEKIFHISIDGLKIKNWRIAGGLQTDMPHLPVSEKTLKISLTKLIGKKNINQDYFQGYTEWKQAFDQKRAGVFTSPITDILAIVEEATVKK